MTRRIPRPTHRPTPVLNRFWAFAIVRASYRLPAGAKLLYGLLLELDRPDKDSVGGAFMGEVDLARQLGMHPDTVSENRRLLVDVGLLHKEVVERVCYWFPMLPAEVEQTPPAGSKALRLITR